MVLTPQSSASHNADIGRRIPHPASTTFNDGPPAKRFKALDSTDGDDSRDASEGEGSFRISRYGDEVPDSDHDDDDGNGLEDESQPSRPTELESALSPIKTDKEAIAEYEAMRASEQDISDDLEDRLKRRQWVKGKSSIYVDAFNFALETVLEDEAHLFNETEMGVFNQWRDLDYEAQYL